MPLFTHIRPLQRRVIQPPTHTSLISNASVSLKQACRIILGKQSYTKYTNKTTGLKKVSSSLESFLDLILVGLGYGNLGSGAHSKLWVLIMVATVFSKVLESH